MSSKELFGASVFFEKAKMLEKVQNVNLGAGVFFVLHPPTERRMANEAPRTPPGGSPGRPRSPGTALRESPYSNCFLGALDTGLRGLLFPSYWLVSQLLALKQTTAEKGKRCPPHALLVLAKGPILVLLLLLSIPVSLLAFLVWLPLQTARRPFAYQHTPSQAQPEEWVLPGKDKTFSFVTSNICLLPEGLARFSNLAHTEWRAKHIAQQLTKAVARRPSALLHKPSSAEGGGTPGRKKYGAMEPSPPRAYQSLPRGDADVTIEFLQEEEEEEEGKAPALGEISARFPAGVDFLCLQEVFDLWATAHMRRLLAPCYEHIIYDVGAYGLVGCSALKVLNSGLFLASRYPVLAVQYHCYPNGTGEDAFAAKGLLSVQVQLGASQGQRIVGYVNCTHLHAPEPDAQIRCDQLSLGLLWAQLFQDAHTQPGDVVAFNVYCGDLNFDNCSSGDEMEQGHEIFSLYTDPCRVGPRKDKPWAIGTLMDYLEIYQEDVSTPENMKRTLEQVSGREKYLAGPVLANGDPDPSATSSEGRRIDYILYREHPGPVELKTAVEKVYFITQLATCSDHLPVGLRLHLTSSAQPDA
ncbi:sphingomyelin phosphodiesterase 5-like [Elgaria multicarinata webbii]|uniref:sphingomyelin phosphodiesterase 5-like n=1 Tax=Elgaria multicarinata webbii TaxID=159646 RepID=UPI002FCD3C02